MKSLLMVALAVLVIFLLLKRRDEANAAKPGANARKKQEIESQPYKGTSIIPGPDACDAAKALADRVYLDSDKSTPNLPLPNCTAPRCRCKYAHHGDRRIEGGDRRLGSSMRSGHYALGEDERRENAGRRDED